MSKVVTSPFYLCRSVNSNIQHFNYNYFLFKKPSVSFEKWSFWPCPYSQSPPWHSLCQSHSYNAKHLRSLKRKSCTAVFIYKWLAIKKVIWSDFRHKSWRKMYGMPLITFLDIYYRKQKCDLVLLLVEASSNTNVCDF